MGRHFWKIIALLVFLLIIFGSTLIRLYTDWMWFRNVGFTTVFSGILLTKVWLFLGTTLLFFVVVYFNLWLARRIAPIPTERLLVTDELRQRLGIYAQRGLGALLTLGALVIAVLVGLGSTTSWDTVLRFVYSTPFGQTDPIFGRDLGFYFFQLPFLQYIYGLVFFALLISLAAVVAFYYMGQAIEFLANIPRFAPRVKSHVFILLALLFLVRAAGYWLDRFGILTSDIGLIPGPGYAEIHGNLPAYTVLMVAAVMAAILTLLNIRRRGIWYAVAGFLGLIGVSIVMGSIYPGMIQRFSVRPNELDRQTPYIVHAVKYTRLGFGLSNVARHTYNVTDTLTQQAIRANEATTQNVRLWDYRPLQRTYEQLQELQPYYKFNDVDIDRYTVNGDYRQVMLSARELQQEGLRAARTWVNRHLVYTHGYGLAMSPVNEVTGRGFPRFFISDIPLVSNVGIEVTTPQVYFGELAEGYALVHTDQEEFDYPAGETNVFTRYSADRGIRMGSFFNKLLFAARLGDLNLLITPQVTSTSRLLFRRTVEERMTALFPFLQFDNDPYLVISGGKLFWMQDAYTVSNRMPYSQQMRMQFNYDPIGAEMNYIRNSVKITMDAYTGDVRAYISDANDPIIRVYSKAFRGVFRPLSEMPEDLRLHIRYPQDMFELQTTVYNIYHMTNPNVFYNKGDLWETPPAQATGDTAGASTTPMEPYYIVMRLPNSANEEFILLRPVTRANRDNMVAWLCAKCDPQDYGDLVLFEFQKGQLVYGPKQVEARAHQDPEISRQLTLWGQGGSTVIWGHLLVFPIENSLLYVQPLYLESTATEARIPEFLRVIVAVGDRIAMEPDLETALSRVIGTGTGAAAPSRPTTPAAPTAPPTPTAAPAAPSPPAAAPTAPSGTTRQLIERANQQFEAAQAAQRRGDWAAYGEQLRALEQTLNQLQTQER